MLDDQVRSYQMSVRFLNISDEVFRWCLSQSYVWRSHILIWYDLLQIADIYPQNQTASGISLTKMVVESIQATRIKVVNETFFLCINWFYALKDSDSFADFRR